MALTKTHPSWAMTLLATILALTNICSAYRVTQHCKPLGENEHYSACTALTQHYNATTQSSDLFVRYNWYKYRSTSNGWHAYGVGKMMKGALMFVFYGDPTYTAGNEYAPMTFSVRSASGHVQPRPLDEQDFLKIPQAAGGTPDVDIVTSHFVPYTGSYVNEKYGETPSHIGVAEFIVRGYTKWVGASVDNTSTAQPMIWSSRYSQEFGGDFGVDRNIDAHKFGLGFGFVYVDLLNAETPVPMFGPIDDSLVGNKGVAEFQNPLAPTDAELLQGQKVIAESHLDAVNSDLGKQADKDQHNPFNDHDTTPNINPPSTDKDQTNNNAGAADGVAAGGAAAGGPASTITRERVRNWLWHLHGLLFSLAFFLLYPMGVYFLRSAKHSANGTSFNYHWTIQAMGTLLFAIAAFIGYLQSSAIHLVHQYVGITLALVLGLQMVSGWRHHMRFIAVKRRTWWSYAHLWAGRLVLPVGLLNILSGMKLRQYGWFTMLLALIGVVAEIVLGGIFLWRASRRRANIGNAVAELKNAGPPGTGEDAEEYFALAGDDDDDEDDDSDVEESAAVQRKREDKAEENRRLARLDRV